MEEAEEAELLKICCALGLEESLRTSIRRQ